jgi:hypothetical protein
MPVELRQVDKSAASYTEHRMEVAREIAEKSNCDVIESDDRSIQLDLDNKAAVDQVLECWSLFLETLAALNTPIESVSAWTSRGGAGLNVNIRLATDLPAGTRIALQAALGSDPKRELLSIMRLGHGMENPSLLFRPRAAQVVTIAAADIPDMRALLRPQEG